MSFSLRIILKLSLQEHMYFLMQFFVGAFFGGGALTNTQIFNYVPGYSLLLKQLGSPIWTMLAYPLSYTYAEADSKFALFRNVVKGHMFCSLWAFLTVLIEVKGSFSLQTEPFFFLLLEIVMRIAQRGRAEDQRVKRTCHIRLGLGWNVPPVFSRTHCHRRKTLAG